MKEVTIKQYMETNDYKQKNENLQKEINSHPLQIDRACFQKTKLEKEISKAAKSEWKKSNK